jgi:hypothetical protein
MNTNKSYKYINLLVRIGIGFFAIYFIASRLKDDLLIGFNKIEFCSIQYRYLILALMLLFINWGLEAIKWKYAIRSTSELSIFKAFKLVLTGITLGFLTPNRIGEVPGRAILLGKQNFKEITLKTAVASFSQLLITLLFGTIGLIYSYSYFIGIPHFHLLILVAIVVLMFLFLIYFKMKVLKSLFNKIRYFKENVTLKGLFEFNKFELLILLTYSFFRYLVFSLQYYMVLQAFGISLTSLTTIFLIPICFMLASFLPTILISEIGVRGSVALFVFGLISELDVQIVLASVVLWCINVAIPALFGLINLKEIKLFKEQ